MNGSPTFSQTFGNGGQISPTQTVTLNVGNLVDFALGANRGYLFDTARFNLNPAIETADYAEVLNGSALTQWVSLSRMRCKDSSPPSSA